MLTATEKLDAVRRELGYRRRVYGRMVEQGTMKPEFMDRRIEEMEEIAADYAKLAEKDRLL